MTLKVKHICMAIAGISLAPVMAAAQVSRHNHHTYQQPVNGYSQPVTVNPYHGGGDFRRVSHGYVLFPQVTSKYSLRPHGYPHQGHGSAYDLKYHGFHGNYTHHGSDRSNAFSRLFGSRRRSGARHVVTYQAMPLRNTLTYQVPMHSGHYMPFGN